MEQQQQNELYIYEHLYTQDTYWKKNHVVIWPHYTKGSFPDVTSQCTHVLLFTSYIRHMRAYATPQCV